MPWLAPRESPRAKFPLWSIPISNVIGSGIVISPPIDQFLSLPASTFLVGYHVHIGRVPYAEEDVNHDYSDTPITHTIISFVGLIQSGQ
jgi:hypothetical protein